MHWFRRSSSSVVRTLFGLVGALLFSATVRAQLCPVPSGGPCFVVHPGPGCDDPACCEAVCAVMPQCCQGPWDPGCVSAAMQLCGGGDFGACCYQGADGLTCGVLSAAECDILGGTFYGPGSSCDGVDCGACEIVCPPGAVLEQEPCGTNSVNPGCDGPAPPLFSLIDCGLDVCGRLWAQQGQFDTDWYEVFVPDPDGNGFQQLCVDFLPEKPTVLEVYSGTCGSLNLLTQVEADCLTGIRFCLCVPAPGTVLIRLYLGTIAGGPDVSGSPCGVPTPRYVVMTDCSQDCGPATGACCYLGPIGATCAELTADECEELSGTFFGVGSACSDVECGPCITPPSGMVGWWPLDEFAGPIANDIVANKDGTYQPSLATGPVPVPAVVLNGLKFDGVDDFVQVPPANIHDFGCGPFTIDAWIHPLLTPSAGGAIVSRTASFGEGYTFGVDSGGYLYLTLGTTCIRCIASSSSPIAWNTWNHVAVTVSACSACGQPCATPPRTITFYNNGAVIGSSSSGTCCDISATAPLLIGTGTLFGDYFDGMIDEVEIFKRELAASEIAAIWSAGDAGKCKDVSSGTWEAACTSPGTATVNITICNNGIFPQNYAWNISPLPGVPGTVCNVNGPAIIVPPNGVVNVPPQSCQSVTATMQCPPGLPLGSHGCFQVCFTNLATGTETCCGGSIYTVKKWKPIAVELFTEIVWGTAKPVAWQVMNIDDPTGVLPFKITVMPDDMQPGPEAVSINGLPPGTRYIGNLAVPQGGTGEIEVDVSYVQFEPFRFYTILLEADLDGDGVFEPISSVATKVVLPDCQADLNGDGVVNGADLGLMLAAWGTPGSPGVDSDLNHDGTTNGADLGLLLAAWGPCGIG